MATDSKWFSALDEREVNIVQRAILMETDGPAPTPENLRFFTPLYVILSLCKMQVRTRMDKDDAYAIIKRVAEAELED